MRSITASNDADVYGNNNWVIISINQNSYGNSVNQYASNEATMHGSGNYVDQSIEQSSPGVKISLRQSGTVSSGFMKQTASTNSKSTRVKATVRI